jgi:hypothetical protein
MSNEGKGGFSSHTASYVKAKIFARCLSHPTFALTNLRRENRLGPRETRVQAQTLAGIRARARTVTVNELPLPGSLSTLTSPPSILA